MKLHATAPLAAATTVVAALGLVGSSHAFQPAPVRHAGGGAPRTPLSMTAPCAMPDDVIPAAVTARGLRAADLTDADGNRVNLGERMGRGTSIVVFLRHLGWPYCWTYANEWRALQQQNAMEDGDVTGPLFVSIGDRDKLRLFLEKNPALDREQIFVDGYDFEAYASAGFGRFDEQPEDVQKAGLKNMGAPELGFKGWLDYLSVTAKVAPIPPDMKFGEIPEGVLRLGGTFVVKGDDIVYRWSDRLPGDHPDIANVKAIADEAAAKKDAGSMLSNLFNFR